MLMFVNVMQPSPVGVAVPPSWAGWRMPNNTVCFKDPGGKRVLGVMPFRPKAESLEGFRELGQNEVAFKGRAIEWEFTYTLLDRKRHAIAVVTSGPTVFWITDDPDFTASRALYDLVKTSFEVRDGATFTNRPLAPK